MNKPGWKTSCCCAPFISQCCPDCFAPQRGRASSRAELPEACNSMKKPLGKAEAAPTDAAHPCKSSSFRLSPALEEVFPATTPGRSHDGLALLGKAMLSCTAAQDQCETNLTLPQIRWIPLHHLPRWQSKELSKLSGRTLFPLIAFLASLKSCGQMGLQYLTYLNNPYYQVIAILQNFHLLFPYHSLHSLLLASFLLSLHFLGDLAYLKQHFELRYLIIICFLFLPAFFLAASVSVRMSLDNFFLDCMWVVEVTAVIFYYTSSLFATLQHYAFSNFSRSEVRNLDSLVFGHFYIPRWHGQNVFHLKDKKFSFNKNVLSRKEKYILYNVSYSNENCCRKKSVQIRPNSTRLSKLLLQLSLFTGNLKQKAWLFFQIS